MEVKDEYLRAFFQKNSDYYIDKWHKFNTGQKVGFKSYALLFGMFWVFYRKMYWEGFVLTIVLLIEGLLETSILGPPETRSADSQKMANALGTIILVLFIGFIGNSLYMRSAKRKISRILANPHVSEELIVERIRKVGGTSFAFLFVIAAIFIVLILLNYSLK